MIAGVAANQNPFPGLRPFREDEERFFFGRESQVDAMVNKLSATCFLAVVGASGSGKSSLVNCGLRPALHRGLMVSAGPAWRIAKFRPGVDPIRSLAEALAAEGVLYSDYKEDIPLKEIIETYLHGSRKGVVETFRKARLPEKTNLLIVADQFEELFRYGKLRTQDGNGAYAISENAIAFVNLLLEARFEPGCPIYIVITLRSDFLGECSQFYGLPEAINDGQYLVPRMTRDERRASIAGPVSVGGADISPVLMTRLLNDVGDNPDQLSILQHALNRTWFCWESHGAKGELELEHYMEIGAMSEALNHHADEAFEQLETPERAKICEKLFKALTDLGTDPRGIRRPLKLATLKEIAGSGSEEDIKAVIEVFREPSRSFLMPPAPEPLEPEKVIDISHESLMRVWERLRRWAEDEAISARRYRRLSETAALEKAGKAGLWGDPDLQLALDWKEEQAPTRAWADLYGGDFESATAFLEKSRFERDHELAEIIFERRWKRIKLIFIFLVVGLFLWRFAKDFDTLSAKFGYNADMAFEPVAESLQRSTEESFRRPQGLRQNLDQVAATVEKADGQKPLHEVVTRDAQILRHSSTSRRELRRYGWNEVRRLSALACLVGAYVLSYFALTYFGKSVFRRFAFRRTLQEVIFSSSKAVREQKLAEQAQALRDAVDTHQTTYASFWHRLGAYVLDLGLFIAGLVGFFWALIACGGDKFLDFLDSVVRNLSFVVLLVPLVIDWLYQALMVSSRRQATPGKLALGIFVTDRRGDRLHFARATTRHFAKVLSYISAGIGFLIQPFTRKRQTLHDLIVRSVVLVRPEKKRVRGWIVVLCVILGLIEALLALGLGISLIAVELDTLKSNRKLGHLQKAADQGNVFAQKKLGWHYQNALGAENLGKAVELYQKAADQGNAGAQNNLGRLYEDGKGVPKDSRKAAELFQKAADKGNAYGQNNLGRLYEDGNGVPKDLQKAEELYQKAANQGNAFAQANLGRLYVNGQGVPKDLAKAAELYQKAADQGNAFAQTSLGWLYENSQGVPKNLKKAAELYQKAADQGYAFALANLGWLYQNGQGVPKDLAKAAELLGKAAELFQEAADQGYVSAQTGLGRLYENGQGVPKDLAKAVELYQKAADQGDDRAQANLGRLYENGQGVPKDLVKAAELYKKAADQGDTAALGWLYQNGQGVPKDLAKAAELYQDAADQGRVFAQNQLGWLYENGQGVPKDLAKAAEFYQRAANHGYEPAIANLKRLSEH